MISKFFFKLTNFCAIICFLTKLVTLFSTSVNAAFVAKPLILGILPSISVINKKIIQVIRRNQVYFSSSNFSTDATVIVKD